MNPNIYVTFKSVPEFFVKEKNGSKPNTVRVIDLNDDRFKVLRRGCKRIVITLPDYSDSFERYVTDYSEWNGFAIISWKS